MRTFLQDLRYGMRMLAKHPWISLVAVITLALGMGVNAVIFSAVYSVLLRPLPYKDADRLVIVGDSDPANPSAGSEITFDEFLEWKARTRSFDDLAAMRAWSPLLRAGASTETLKGGLVSADFFQVFDMNLLTGRTLSAGDTQNAAVPSVVIAESLWVRAFAKDPAIVGRTVLLDDMTFSIAGVVSDTTKYPSTQEVWASLEAAGPAQTLSETSRRNITSIGRLAAGTDATRAQTELRAIRAASGTAALRVTDTGLTVIVTPLLESLIGKSRIGLLILQWAVAFVLLIACANLTNLLLAQAASRQKEFGIRVALGATRKRLVVQMLSESFVLSALGAVAGLVAAQWTLKYFERTFTERLGRSGIFHGIAIDARVAAWMSVVAILTAIIVGLTPALTASKPNLERFLRSGGRGTGGSPQHRRIQAMLVVSEIALATMLLISAGLMIRTFNNLISADMGFRTENVLTMRVMLPEDKYPDTARMNQFFTDVETRVRALPGVESFAAVTYLPLIGYNPGISFRVDGQAPEATPARADIQPITPGYFEVLRIPFQRGQIFNANNGAESSVEAVVNNSFVKKFLPETNPIGATLRLGDTAEGMQAVRIVGVVNDVRQWGMLFDPRPEIYVQPGSRLKSRRTPYLVIGTTVRPERLANAVRKEVAGVDSDLEASSPQSLSSILYYSVERRRVLGFLLTFLGAVAIAMVSIAIYGVIAYSIIERWHEIGVRVALGATRNSVLQMVLRHGMHMVLVGVALGGIGAAGVMRLIRSYLYGVSIIDPLTYVSVGTLISAVALAACYFPARRATRVDPIIALRCE